MARYIKLYICQHNPYQMRYTISNMPHWFQAIIVLLIVWVTARVIKRNMGLLKNYFIPSSIIGGVLLLLIGPQVLQIIPQDIMQPLYPLPALLINVVFAALFLGKAIPSARQVWERAGPMIALGNTIAWGMYVIGIALTLLILGPLFGAPPIFGALLEISFTGGHGTSAGLAPTFASLGYANVTDMALGLATFSIITAVIVGITVTNIYNRRIGRILDKASMNVQQQRMVRNGYDLTRVTRQFEKNPLEILRAIFLIALSIGIGWLLWQGMIWAEDTLLNGHTNLRIFAHVPLFPLAMLGGLIVQFAISKANKTHWVNAKTIGIISSIALDLLIITAIGTMSLNTIGSNLPASIILAAAGIAWILFAFFFFAPRYFRKPWFEYGLTDVGQAMGMTATGLLLNRLVDPLNHTGARESFAYKQLAFEPFMGGGVVTAFAVVAIVEFGQLPLLVLSLVVTAFWIVVGLLLGRQRHLRLRHQLNIGWFASHH